MLLLKILGTLFLCASGTATGINVISKLKKRADALDWYYKSAAQIGSRIGGTAAELYDIINTLHSKEEYLNISKPLKIDLKNNFLSREDHLIICEFFSNLGEGNIEEETKRCEMYSNIFYERYKNARKEYTEKAKLYKMLGLFSGLAVAIIIM